MKRGFAALKNPKLPSYKIGAQFYVTRLRRCQKSLEHQFTPLQKTSFNVNQEISEFAVRKTLKGLQEKAKSYLLSSVVLDLKNAGINS